MPSVAKLLSRKLLCFPSPEIILWVVEDFKDLEGHQGMLVLTELEQ